jgi:lipoic acid synthetase
MILGDICTRHCGFCDVTAGKPRAVDPAEPRQVAEMVAILGLRHVVITCVARDDLADRGAGQFVKCIREIRTQTPQTRVEILTTDFSLRYDVIDEVLAERPDVFNHNIETVERLTPRVRHRASYRNTLSFLQYLKRCRPDQVTKSGLMLGLGERRDEVVATLSDLREVGCDIVTIGQYLRPAKRNLPVVAFVPPELFKQYERIAYRLGFVSVASGPFVRSSYHAEKMVTRDDGRSMRDDRRGTKDEGHKDH